MKSLAFFCSVWLLVLVARAEIATGVTVPSATVAQPAANWAGAIEKFTKENLDPVTENVDGKLLEHSLQEFERPVAVLPGSAASAPALRASAPALRASGAAGSANAAFGPTDTPSSADKRDEDDWASAIRHTVWDIVKPYQDFIPGVGARERPPAEDTQDPGARIAQTPAPPRYTPKSEAQREGERLRSDYLISQLIDEVKPWAIGIVSAALMALGLSQWLAYLKRKQRIKHGVKHGRHLISRKRRRKSSRRLDA